MPYVTAEVWWAAHREHALTVEDVLARRTRAALLDPCQAAAAAPVVGEILGDGLGWSGRRRRIAVGDYGASAEQYRIQAEDDEPRQAFAT
ncbi:MAG: glycerol-3-phosphate dehydrogenase C-terminal domain-containing protein [Nitriliruptorales bacterium]